MITIEAGDVVIVDFIGVRETKRRPAIVLSGAAYNQQRTDLIVAMVTSNIELASTPFDVTLSD